MSVKIEFNAETSAKVHEEMVDFARLFLGGVQAVTSQDTQIKPVSVETPQIPVKSVEQAEVKDEEIKVEAVAEKPKATRKRATAPKAETVEKVEAPENGEETAAEAKEDEIKEDEAKEEATDTKPDSSYGEGFEDCKDDLAVINKVRAFLNEFNQTAGNPPKAKAVFATYGVPTVLKMSSAQAIDFYNKLQAI